MVGSSPTTLSPKFNTPLIQFTYNDIAMQLEQNLATQYQQFKIVSATVKWRLESGTANDFYLFTEVYTGSYRDIYGNIVVNNAEIGEIFQLPGGRKHGRGGGSRRYKPMTFKIDKFDGTGDSTVNTSYGGWIQCKEIPVNVKYSGIGLLLPGLIPIDPTATNLSLHVPKWQMSITVTLAVKGQINFNADT